MACLIWMDSSLCKSGTRQPNLSQKSKGTRFSCATPRTEQFAAKRSPSGMVSLTCAVLRPRRYCCCSLLTSLFHFKTPRQSFEQFEPFRARTFVENSIVSVMCYLQQLGRLANMSRVRYVRHPKIDLLAWMIEELKSGVIHTCRSRGAFVLCHPLSQ